MCVLTAQLGYTYVNRSQTAGGGLRQLTQRIDPVRKHQTTSPGYPVWCCVSERKGQPSRLLISAQHATVQDTEIMAKRNKRIWKDDLVSSVCSVHWSDIVQENHWRNTEGWRTTCLSQGHPERLHKEIVWHLKAISTIILQLNDFRPRTHSERLKNSSTTKPKKACTFEGSPRGPPWHQWTETSY